MPSYFADVPEGVDFAWCPQGCGATTEDPYGGPCAACWRKVDGRYEDVDPEEFRRETFGTWAPDPGSPVRTRVPRGVPVAEEVDFSVGIGEEAPIRRADRRPKRVRHDPGALIEEQDEDGAR